MLLRPPDAGKTMLTRTLALGACLTGALFALASAENAHHQSAHKPLIHHTLQSWNMEDGLPQPTVSALAQDRYGYIWLGVQAGLVRFDGARFVAFDSSNSGIPNERVNALKLDRQDRLWVGTQSGPAYIEVDGLIRADMQTLPELTDPVHQFLSLADGSMAMASRGLPVIAPDGQVHRLLPEQVDIRALAVSSGGQLWAGGIGQIFHGKPEQLVAIDFPPERAHHSVTGLAWWDEQLWIGTNSGLLRFDPAAHRFKEVGLPPPAREHGESISLVEHNEGLWIGTFHAVFHIDANGTWDKADRHQFDDHPWVSALLRDREGHLWFGSQTEGLTRARRGWTRRYDRVLGLNDNFVWSVALGPDDTVWLGTNTGVSALRNGRIEKLIDASELPNPSVYSMFRASDGRAFLGTQSGLAIHDGDSVQLPDTPDTLSRARVHSFLEQSDGSVLIGSDNGIFLEQAGQVSPFEVPGLQPGQSVRFLGLVNGALWVGSDRGLIIPYDTGATPLPDSLQSAMITGILQLDDQHWLIGTYRQGLHLFSQHQGWISLDRSHGLYDDSAFSLTRDQHDRVWISSHLGLQQTTVAALIQGEPTRDMRMVISSGGREPGAIPMRCCNGAGHGKALLHNQELWLPTLQGAIAVEIDQVIDNPTVPAIIIEELQTRSGERYIDQHRVELPAAARHFRILFTGLSFRDPRGVRFRYRIPGFDPDWSEPSAQRYADYTNLPPGEHVFEVMAANDSGLWSDSPAMLSIHIAPYWYEHNLFRAALAVALVLSVLLLIRWRTARGERLRRVLALHVEQRTSELATANQRLDELNRELAELSETDSLTHLRNRRFAMRQLQQDAQFYQRKAIAGEAPEVAMACVLVDLDHFKKVNDQHGHAAGDAILVEFARRALQISRDSDYLIRWGGEEFLLVLRETSLHQACQFAERLCHLISTEPFKVVDQLELDISCSAGISALTANPQCSDHWDRCIEVADFALYQAKADGRNRWCAIASESVVHLLGQSGGIQSALLDMQARGELQLHTSGQR